MVTVTVTVTVTMTVILEDTDKGSMMPSKRIDVSDVDGNNYNIQVITTATVLIHVTK